MKLQIRGREKQTKSVAPRVGTQASLGLAHGTVGGFSSPTLGLWRIFFPRKYYFLLCLCPGFMDSWEGPGLTNDIIRGLWLTSGSFQSTLVLSVFCVLVKAGPFHRGRAQGLESNGALTVSSRAGL